MTEFNPYEHPTADLTPTYNQGNPDGIERIGKKKLFVVHGVDLPNRCIKCNKPTHNQKIITFRKSYGLRLGLINVLFCILMDFLNMQQYVLIFYSLYAISSIVISGFQEKYPLKVSLCDTHKRKRTLGVTFGFLAFIGSLASYVYLNIKQSDSSINLVILAFIPISLVFFTYQYHLLKMVKLSDISVELKRFGKEFLESFEDEK